MSAQFPSACVAWPGRKDRDGYPITRIGRKYKTVGRVLLELFVGAGPEGAHVLHSCDNPACVNPRHLRWGTPKENAADRVQRLRQPRGVNAPNAKLSGAAVIEIRAGLSCHEACSRFGIRKSSYYRVLAGESYQ